MRGFLSASRFSLVWVLNKLLLPKNPNFDRRFGTVTNDWVEVSEGEIPPEAFDTAVRYVPVRPHVIDHICRKLPIDHRDYSFVDMGSGRGRALLLASNYPFQKIIGVEISPKHHEIAQSNVDVYRSKKQRCKEITPICENALSYRFPSGNLVVFLYQPFGGSVLQRVLSNIQDRAGEENEVFLCFCAPYHNQDIILKSGYLGLIDSFPAYSSEDSWILYGNSLASKKFGAARVS